jgi:predicted RNA-binding Zn-ribbon protein involved in translation (DUF1610 family)
MTQNWATLEICALCGKETEAILLDKRMRKVFDICTTTGNLCLSCQEQVKTNITFSCATCHSIHVVKIEAVRKWGLTVQAGDRYKTYKCPECSPDKSFVLRPPDSNSNN